MRGSSMLCDRKGRPEPPLTCARLRLLGMQTPLSLPPSSCQAAAVLQAAFRGHLARTKLFPGKVCGSASPSAPSRPNQVTPGGGTQPPVPPPLPVLPPTHHGPSGHAMHLGSGAKWL